MRLFDVIAMPADLLRSLAESADALARLPATVQETLHETNALITDARAQLARLGDQIGRMMAQLDQMATVTDKLVEGAAAISAVAATAERQIAATTTELAAANRSLEQIVRIAEPFDRFGKRVVERFSRVTGRGLPEDEPEPE